MEKDDFDAGADDVETRVADIDPMHAEPSAGLDDADFDAKLASAQARLQAFNSQSANANLGASGGDGGRAAEGGAEGSMLGPIGLGLGSLLPGIGGAAAGMGLLGATGLAAFGDIGKALEAQSQASQNIGIISPPMAATTFTNSVASSRSRRCRRRTGRPLRTRERRVHPFSVRGRNRVAVGGREPPGVGSSTNRAMLQIGVAVIGSLLATTYWGPHDSGPSPYHVPAHIMQPIRPLWRRPASSHARRRNTRAAAGRAARDAFISGMDLDFATAAAVPVARHDEPQCPSRRWQRPGLRVGR